MLKMWEDRRREFSRNYSMTKETEGAFATISGFFSEKLLDFGSYRKTQVINASSAAAVKAGITTYIGNANAAVVVDGKIIQAAKISCNRFGFGVPI